MKRLLMTGLVGMLLCGVCFCQDGSPAPVGNSPPQGAQTNEKLKIAPGSVIPVQLTRTVDAKKAKTGDEVDAKVTQDLKSVSGDVLVPKDTKVIGHVTEAQARNKEEKESQLAIAFDQAVMKDGSSSALPMSIQAIIAPSTQSTDSGGPMGGAAPPPESSAPNSGMSPSGAGRSGAMASAPPPSAPGSYPTGGGQPSAGTNSSDARPNITAKTQGVVGIANYSLSTAGDSTKGSVVSSEKGNVKLESGTLMLLRVNQ